MQRLILAPAICATGFLGKSYPLEVEAILQLPLQPPASMLRLEVANNINRKGLWLFLLKAA
jgi:hypothetical protein